MVAVAECTVQREGFWAMRRMQIPEGYGAVEGGNGRASVRGYGILWLFIRV